MISHLFKFKKYIGISQNAWHFPIILSYFLDRSFDWWPLFLGCFKNQIIFKVTSMLMRFWKVEQTPSSLLMQWDTISSVGHSAVWVVYGSDSEWATEIEWERVEGRNGSRKEPPSWSSSSSGKSITISINISMISIVVVTMRKTRVCMRRLGGRLEEVKAGKRGWGCTLLQPPVHPNTTQYNSVQ